MLPFLSIFQLLGVVTRLKNPSIRKKFGAGLRLKKRKVFQIVKNCCWESSKNLKMPKKSEKRDNETKNLMISSRIFSKSILSIFSNVSILSIQRFLNYWESLPCYHLWRKFLVPCLINICRSVITLKDGV